MEINMKMSSLTLFIKHQYKNNLFVHHAGNGDPCTQADPEVEVVCIGKEGSFLSNTRFQVRVAEKEDF